MTLTFDLLSLKVVSESRVTCAISVPILVFLGLYVLELRPMYATDRRQIKASLNAPPQSFSLEVIAVVGDVGHRAPSVYEVGSW